MIFIIHFIAKYYNIKEKFIKAFLINLIMSIITFVGLVLFIVPGIIFGLMYSQAYYILADNPELVEEITALIQQAITAKQNA